MAVPRLTRIDVLERGSMWPSSTALEISKQISTEDQISQHSTTVPHHHSPPAKMRMRHIHVFISLALAPVRGQSIPPPSSFEIDLSNGTQSTEKEQRHIEQIKAVVRTRPCIGGTHHQSMGELPQRPRVRLRPHP
jgi:hypothetical protein